MNPYATPETSGRRHARRERPSPWRFLVYTLFFYPVWFFVGGAFSIDGSEEGMAVDVGLLLGVVGASAITFLVGLVATMRDSGSPSD